MMAFIQFPIEQHAPGFENWRERFRAVHGREPDPPVVADFTYCHENAEEAERGAREYVARYFLSVVKHYEFLGDHFANTKGYTAYAEATGLIKEAGLEAAAQGFTDAQIWGTPEQILEKYRHRLEVLGSLSPDVLFSFAGMPYDKVEASMNLFAREVLPELKKMKNRIPAATATSN